MAPWWDPTGRSNYLKGTGARPQTIMTSFNYLAEPEGGDNECKTALPPSAWLALDLQWWPQFSLHLKFKLVLVPGICPWSRYLPMWPCWLNLLLLISPFLWLMYWDEWPIVCLDSLSLWFCPKALGIPCFGRFLMLDLLTGLKSTAAQSGSFISHGWCGTHGNQTDSD